MLTEDAVKSALKAVKYPGYSRDIVSFGLIKEIAAKDGAVSVVMQLTGGSSEVAQQIKTESEQALRAMPGVKMAYVEVRFQAQPATGGAASPWAQQNRMPGIGRVVAVVTAQVALS